MVHNKLGKRNYIVVSTYPQDPHLWIQPTEDRKSVGDYKLSSSVDETLSHVPSLFVFKRFKRWRA